MNSPATDPVRALAQGDFSRPAVCFVQAGFAVRQPAPGILQIAAPDRVPERPRLLMSVGIHGDETAPIEMLAHLLAALATAPHELAMDLMVVVGNVAAIAQGRRYLDVDLNRLFHTGRAGSLQTAEAGRADLIMRASAAFFASSGGAKWHFDLHTAIHASLYPSFAIVPDALTEADQRALGAWLGRAGIGAVLFNRLPAATYSAYTAAQFGAVSCTLELGQVAAFGNNDLALFSATRAALDALVRSRPLPAGQSRPAQFGVAQELIKQSEDFTMQFDRATRNFTPVEPGAVIAHDGEVVYRAGGTTEYLVFPNPDVAIGQRAGLTVVRRMFSQ
jgi:succinylglutamate desuccinylase